MSVAEIVGWTFLIALTVAGVALVSVAVMTRRHRLAIPAVIPVIVAIAVGASGAAAPHPVVALLVALGVGAIGVIGGSPAVSLLLRYATKGDADLGTHGGILVRSTDSLLPQREILRGGAIIGYLERFALIGAVIAGQAAAVAIIVAIKGLGRFAELENEQARERFIIGTLASLTFAGLCAAAAELVVGL